MYKTKLQILFLLVINAIINYYLINTTWSSALLHFPNFSILAPLLKTTFNIHSSKISCYSGTCYLMTLIHIDSVSYFFIPCESYSRVISKVVLITKTTGPKRAKVVSLFIPIKDYTVLFLYKCKNIYIISIHTYVDLGKQLVVDIGLREVGGPEAYVLVGVGRGGHALPGGHELARLAHRVVGRRRRHGRHLHARVPVALQHVARLQAPRFTHIAIASNVPLLGIGFVSHVAEGSGIGKALD